MKALIITLTAILITISILNSYSQNNSGNTNMIFHDYVPDLLLDKYSDTLKIDINQDNILDVEFYFYDTSSGGYFYIKSLNKNCQYAFLSSTYSDSLSSNELYWVESNNVWLSIDNTEKLGFKFKFNDFHYYGWLHGIQSWVGGANGKNTLTIDKYAFCTIANYPLLWGQTEIITGNKPINSNNNIKVFVNGTGDSIVVQSDKIIKTIKLLSLSGAVVKIWDKVQSMNATLSTTGLAHGAYLVQVTYSGNKLVTEKIVL